MPHAMIQTTIIHRAGNQSMGFSVIGYAASFGFEFLCNIWEELRVIRLHEYVVILLSITREIMLDFPYPVCGY